MFRDDEMDIDDPNDNDLDNIISQLETLDINSWEANHTTLTRTEDEKPKPAKHHFIGTNIFILSEDATLDTIKNLPSDINTIAINAKVTSKQLSMLPRQITTVHLREDVSEKLIYAIPSHIRKITISKKVSVSTKLSILKLIDSAKAPTTRFSRNTSPKTENKRKLPNEDNAEQKSPYKKTRVSTLTSPSLTIQHNLSTMPTSNKRKFSDQREIKQPSPFKKLRSQRQSSPSLSINPDIKNKPVKRKLFQLTKEECKSPFKKSKMSEQKGSLKRARSESNPDAVEEKAIKTFKSTNATPVSTSFTEHLKRKNLENREQSNRSSKMRRTDRRLQQTTFLLPANRKSTNKNSYTTLRHMR